MTGENGLQQGLSELNKLRELAVNLSVDFANTREVPEFARSEATFYVNLVLSEVSRLGQHLLDDSPTDADEAEIDSLGDQIAQILDGHRRGVALHALAECVGFALDHAASAERKTDEAAA